MKPAKRRRRRLEILRGYILRFLLPVWRPLSLAGQYLLALFVRALVRLMKKVDPDKSSDFFGKLARFWGPYIITSRTGRRNLRLAFPENTESQNEEILRGVWENLGRVAGEFAHLEQFWDYDHSRPNQGRAETYATEKFIALRDSGKPALIFTAHLANWELAAVCAAAHELDAAILFRTPNNRFVADIIHETRAKTMGQLLPAGLQGTFAMGNTLERGGHVGMLVDQYRNARKGGVPVTFFGHQTLANSTIMRLARQYDCPVHGVRVVRLPKNRFRVDLTDPVDLPRDAKGRYDIQPSMQTIMSIIEGWIREHPEQWLWLHRRWRN